MVVADVKYNRNIVDLPPWTYNVVNIYTREYVQQGRPDAKYYLFHNGNKDDEWQRVVDLNYLKIVDTEAHDDLTPYGFTLVRVSPNGIKRWFSK